MPKIYFTLDTDVKMPSDVSLSLKVYHEQSFSWTGENLDTILADLLSEVTCLNEYCLLGLYLQPICWRMYSLYCPDLPLWKKTWLWIWFVLHTKTHLGIEHSWGLWSRFEVKPHKNIAHINISKIIEQHNTWLRVQDHINYYLFYNIELIIRVMQPRGNIREITSADLLNWAFNAIFSIRIVLEQ